MNIPLSKLEQLVDGEITLGDLVASTSTTIDDTVLAAAQSAVALLATNKHLLNLALSYLNVPVTFTGAADAAVVTEPIAGLDELRFVFSACDCDDGKCGD